MCRGMVQSRVTLCMTARRPIRPFTVWSVPLVGDHLNQATFQEGSSSPISKARNDFGLRSDTGRNTLHRGSLRRWHKVATFGNFLGSSSSPISKARNDFGLRSDAGRNILHCGSLCRWHKVATFGNFLRGSSSPISKARNDFGLRSDAGRNTIRRGSLRRWHKVATFGNFLGRVLMSLSPISKARNDFGLTSDMGRNTIHCGSLRQWHQVATFGNFSGLVQNRRCSGNSTDGRRAGNRMSRTSGSKWRKMAHFGEAFWAISLSPEAIRNGAFRGWAELRSLERKPLMRQALRRGILPVSKPTSGPRSSVSDRPSDRGTPASNVRRRARVAHQSSRTHAHTTQPGGHGVRTPSALNPYLPQCCVFKKT